MHDEKNMMQREMLNSLHLQQDAGPFGFTTYAERLTQPVELSSSKMPPKMMPSLMPGS